MLLGIDPIHFAIILIVNIELALITPPIGLNLYVMSGACKEPFEKVVKGVFPSILTMIGGLLIITHWSGISLYLTFSAVLAVTTSYRENCLFSTMESRPQARRPSQARSKWRGKLSAMEWER